jgi:hypothetical protein
MNLSLRCELQESVHFIVAAELRGQDHSYYDSLVSAKK